MRKRLVWWIMGLALVVVAGLILYPVFAPARENGWSEIRVLREGFPALHRTTGRWPVDHSSLQEAVLNRTGRAATIRAVLLENLGDEATYFVMTPQASFKWHFHKSGKVTQTDWKLYEILEAGALERGKGQGGTP